VDLQLVDRDGKPLGNREVILEAFADPNLGSFPGPTGGTVSPSRVRTDSNGHAKVTFTAGNKPGAGTIPAYSVYFRPPGNKLAFLASAMVNIEDSAKWLVQADFAATDTIDQNYVVTDKHGQTTRRLEQSTTESRYHVNYFCYPESKTSSLCGPNPPNGTGAGGFATATTAADGLVFSGYTTLSDSRQYYERAQNSDLSWREDIDLD
jgi:hypothetical protein